MNTTDIYAFTSAACNYLPKAEVLRQSLRRYHPEIRLVLALPDRIPDGLDLSKQGWDETLAIEDLGIPMWRPWAFTHSLVELATAVKPFVMASLLGRPGCRAVLYFDPDIVLFSRLDDLINQLEEADILLTPHQTSPEQGLEEVMDNEICSLKHGVYNLGFIGVRPTANGRNFARWWSERLYYFCQDDIPNGLFTDQRWIDLAPALFGGVKISRNPRFNVAPWNLTTRRIAVGGAHEYTVNNEPLGFYHFTGFDSGAHRIMTTKYGRDSPALSQLQKWYEFHTSGVSQSPLTHIPWAFGSYEDGLPVLDVHRKIYRSRPDLQRQYPEPFREDLAARTASRIGAKQLERRNTNIRWQRPRRIDISVVIPGLLGRPLRLHPEGFQA